MNEYQKLAWNGLWRNNPALTQILGLCPLLAVSNSAINALGLGLATLLVLLLSNGLVSLSRHWIRPEIRIPVFVLLIAGAVTAVEMLMQALFYGLYQSLGIFLSLIVTNCAIIARAEAYAVKQPLRHALWDGLMMGLGFAWALLLLGMLREWLAEGTLFAGSEALLGWDFSIQLPSPLPPLLLAALPAGAFIALGLLLAAKNALDSAFSTKKKG